MRLKDRVANITGAAQGIGWASAQRFAAEGARLVLVDNNADKLRTGAQKLSDQGAVVTSAVADVRSSAEVSALVADAVATHGAIDIVVNNAGGSGSINAFEIETITDEAWALSLALNLTSTFLFCRAVIPHMRERRYGRIVNVSSGLARGHGRPMPTAGAVLPYATAKAGVLGLTTNLAKMVAASGITVNAVVPGFVLTEPGARVRDWFDQLPKEGQAAMLARTSMGRAGEAGEIASAILFLASEEAGFVSGTTVDVNGAS
jgi:NAD(P)-dependent dehydrogenase (short-subunit alcohol dehydrogenase family)